MCRSDKVWCVKGVKSGAERFTAHPTVSASLADRNHAFDLNLFKIKSKNQLSKPKHRFIWRFTAHPTVRAFLAQSLADLNHAFHHKNLNVF